MEKNRIKSAGQKSRDAIRKNQSDSKNKKDSPKEVLLRTKRLIKDV